MKGNQVTDEESIPWQLTTRPRRLLYSIIACIKEDLIVT